MGVIGISYHLVFYYGIVHHHMQVITKICPISETSVSGYALALFVNVLAYFQDMEGLINVL